MTQSLRNHDGLGSSFWLGRSTLAGLLLIFAVFVAYAPVWRAAYIWDDDVLLTINPCIVGPLGLKEIWTTQAADICPLTITTLWAAHKLWGLWPLPYHVLNVLMHAACAVLFWRVLLELRVPGAWLGAALWALHPVQVESAAWIAEMKNTQSGVFYLATVLCFLHSLGSREIRGEGGRWKPDGLTILCAALAMASKSSTVILPVVLCLVAWWMDGRWQWRRLLEVAPIFALSLAATLLSVWTQWLQPTASTGLQTGRTWPQRLIIAGDAVWFYLGKLAWPHPLITVYPRWEVGTGTASAFLPLAAVFVVWLILWWKRRSWGLSFLLTWTYFLVALLPTLGLVEMSFFRYSFVADHFVYLASMGPLALAGAGVVRLRHIPSLPRWSQAVVSTGLLLVLGAASWHRAWAYRNQETVWTDTLAKNPRCWVAYGNLGIAAAERGQLDAAIARYHAALKLGPDEARTHANLGSIFQRQGRLDQAVAEYREALRISPRNVEAYYSLGNIFLDEGQIDQAVAEFRSALKVNDNFIAAHSNLGAAFKLNGQLDNAAAEYENALRIDPKNVQNLNNLGNIFLQKGQPDKALAQYQEALKINPEDAYTYRNLGNMLSQRGRLDDAVVEYQAALKIAPADAESRNNLGNVFLQKGQLSDAFVQYQTAVRIDPTYASAHRNLGLVYMRQGRPVDALTQFRDAVRLKPDFTEAQHDLAAAQAMANQAASPP